jgi:hypothetical protein
MTHVLDWSESVAILHGLPTVVADICTDLGQQHRHAGDVVSTLAAAFNGGGNAAALKALKVSLKNTLSDLNLKTDSVLVGTAGQHVVQQLYGRKNNLLRLGGTTDSEGVM